MISHYVVLYCTIVQYSASYHIISYHIISYHNHVTSYHVISYHIILSYHIIISYCIGSYHSISCHIMSYHVALYHIKSCHIISYYIISLSSIVAMTHPQRHLLGSKYVECFGEKHSRSLDHLDLQTQELILDCRAVTTFVRIAPCDHRSICSDGSESLSSSVHLLNVCELMLDSGAVTTTR